MSTVVAYGIDFGTTNSSLAIAYEDGTIAVLDTGADAQVLPSLVYLHRGGDRVAGTEGLRAFLNTATNSTRCSSCELVSWERGTGYSNCGQFRPGGKCLDARLLSQIKSDLSDEAFHYTHSWAVDFPLEDLVAVVLRSLKRAADNQARISVDRVALGHPVRFLGADGPGFEDQQALACERLRRAAERAGFRDVRLVPEPQAAIALDPAYDGLVVCTDFGGGTFDVAVVDVHGDDAEVLALEGVHIGGNEFDGKIFDKVVAPALGLKADFVLPDGQTRRLPASIQSGLRTLSGLKLLLAEGDVPGAISALWGCGHDELLQLVGELLYGGQAWSFYRAIEQAKVHLSDAEETRIEFTRDWIDLRLPLTRTEFEHIISDDLSRVTACIGDALDEAGVAPHDVTLVSRTGGSSQIPAYLSRLEELFPEAEMVQSDPFTCVVQGLAEYALEEWST